MNKLIYVIFLATFFLDFLHANIGIIPRSATWIPELLAIITSIVIVLRLAVNRRLSLEPKYIYLLTLYVGVIFTGIIYNNVPLFNSFVGVRVHLKHLPLFLLPAVYDFSEYEFKKQLNVILPLLLLQCPISVSQKIFFYFFRRKFTGDVVQGTLGSANPLAIFMICSIAMLYAFYLKKRISLRTFLLAGIILFIPNTICESKATIFLLPIALMLPVLWCEDYIKGERQKKILTGIFVSVVLFAIFIPMYNLIMQSIPQTARAYKIKDSFTKMLDMDYLIKYLYMGTDRNISQIRRGDQIVLAYNNLLQESPANLALGIGIGKSFVSYFDNSSQNNSKFSRNIIYDTSTLSLSFLFWEVGALGVLLYIITFLVLLRDARFMSKSPNLFGTFALGWCSVVVIMLLSLGYFNTISYNSLDLLFWYFSGIIAVHAAKYRKERELSYAAYMLKKSGFGKREFSALDCHFRSRPTMQK